MCVILLTFPDSLIPYKMGLNFFAGQVVRYDRICSHFKDFIDKTRVNLLTVTLNINCNLTPKDPYIRIVIFCINLFFTATQVSISVGLCSEFTVMSVFYLL